MKPIIPPVESANISALPPQKPEEKINPRSIIAFKDLDFIAREDLRPIRLQLEYLKTDMLLKEWNVRSTIAVFGSARIPSPETALILLENARKTKNPRIREQELARAEKLLGQAKIYEKARALSFLIAKESQKRFQCDHICRDFVISTGGGPGIMEASNRGAADAESPNIGFNIELPHEQYPNPYITPDLNFRFHYFALRKMHFMLRARALVYFPGGFGTLDEMFEALTLIQTGKVEALPIILFYKEFWNKLINFDFLLEQGMISASDLALLQFVDTPEQAWKIIVDFHDKKPIPPSNT